MSSGEGVLLVIMIAWASWASISIIKQGNTIVRILQNCHQHQRDKMKIRFLMNSVETINRNIIRLSMHSGMPGSDELETLDAFPVEEDEGDTQ